MVLVSISYSLTLEQIIFSYLETGDTFKYEEITCNEKPYEVVISGGKEIFMFEKINERYYFIKDKELIKEILLCYYSDYKNITLDNQFDKLEEAKEYTTEFFESRENQEAACKQYTGTDRLPCEDQTSCLVACRTVYICDTYSFGIGLDFVDLIFAYNQNVNTLDKFEAEYEELFDEAIEKQDLESLEELEDYLSEISICSKNIELSDLTILYSFCPEVKYSTSDLTSAKSIISNIKNNIEPLYKVDETVDYIYSETVSRKADYTIPKIEIKVFKYNGNIINSMTNLV